MDSIDYKIVNILSIRLFKQSIYCYNELVKKSTKGMEQGFLFHVRSN